MEDEEKPFCVDRAKLGRAGCKKCKQKCLQGELRIAKLAPSPFGEGKVKNWHHVDCLFEQFLKQRPTTKRLESSEELDGWDTLNDEDKKEISDKWTECEKLIAKKLGNEYKEKEFVSSPSKASSSNESKASPGSKKDGSKESQDNSFKEFRKLVAGISNVSSYTEKTVLVADLFKNGSDGKGFQGDLVLWCSLLLPGSVKRIYNLQSKQLIKLFSKIFKTDHDDMLEHLEQGDVGETIEHFFKQSRTFIPAKKSLLTLQEVDDFLEKLSQLTKEDEQMRHIKLFAAKCTSGDLKSVIRLIKHDLRMNAGPKHILEAVHPGAYTAYQASNNIRSVIENCYSTKSSFKGITLLTPVLPMLAEACKNIQQAMKKCPNGMYSEIKYDGERVQVHKKGSEFKYYSRSLKPVMQHKIAHFKEFIPKAFPSGKDLILDSEILMVDVKTGKPLPFGTLGVHKKNGLKDATVCLFVFDCIYYNGEDLSDKPLKTRKKILKENMTEIPNHIHFSEMEEIHQPEDLANMITKVLKMGLEGLVLKDIIGKYEPGKRHWLKVKKDYLFDGAMADSADLIVLGAWYGTGKKGGIMSVFLMGVYDPHAKVFCTVTKVHTGLDDKTLEKLQDELDMVKISQDANKVPKWLNCTKTMIPDFVAKDPKAQPVWKITGAEFSQQYDVHTANGISIRFPRITERRDDKTWETATNLIELNKLFVTSKENFDGSLFNKELEALGDTKPSPSKVKQSPKKSPTKRQAGTMDKFLVKKDVNDSNEETSPKKIKLEDKVSPKKIKLEDEIVNKIKTRIVEINNPLPDYFESVNILLEEGVEQKYPNYLRHFVGFSGRIVKGIYADSATHVLHDSSWVSVQSSTCPKTVKHVTVEWIRQCILSKCLVREGPYMVKLLPSKKLAE